MLFVEKNQQLKDFKQQLTKNKHTYINFRIKLPLITRLIKIILGDRHTIVVH